MKILNINPTLQTTSKSKTINFKANPVVQKQIATLVKGEGRHLFQILAGTLGLSSIIAWVKALRTEDVDRVNERLDVYNTKFTEEWNSKVLESTNEALEVASDLDAIESGIWTRGIISEDSDLPRVSNVTILQKKMFFNTKADETFPNVLAEASLKTIKKYVEALLSANDEVKEKAIRDIETRFDHIVKEAKRMKESQATEALYDKLSNLTKLYILNNLVGLSNVDENEIKVETESKEKIVVPEQERQVSEGYDPVEQAKEFLKRKLLPK